MKKVTLTRLPIVALSVTYARRMEDNKIIHYKISMASLIAAMVGAADANPYKEVQNYIRQTEGEDIEFDLKVSEFNRSLETEDVTYKALKDHPDIVKQLKKYKCNSTIHQWNVYENKMDQYKDLLSYYVNKYVYGPINNFHAKMSKATFVFPLLKYLRTDRYMRHIVPVTYLAYKYEEQDEQKAFDALAKDLKILSDNDLIMGHLSMPGTIKLADVIGSGNSTKALFCYLIVNTSKLTKDILKKSPLDFPPGHKICSEIGVTGEMYEGECSNIKSGFDPDSKYTIEEVYVGSVVERSHDLMIESYTKSRDHVNDVAKRMKDGLKNCVIEKSSYVHSPNKLAVDIKITKITAEGN